MTVYHEHIMQFFSYKHLPSDLQRVSQPICDLARRIEQTLPRNPERTVALRKLLEAKDAAVLSFASKPRPVPEPSHPGDFMRDTHAQTAQDLELAFAYAQLPEQLQHVSEPFAMLSRLLEGLLPENRQRVIVFDRLLEAKNAAVRARLAREPQSITPGDVGPVSSVRAPDAPDAEPKP